MQWYEISILIVLGLVILYFLCFLILSFILVYHLSHPKCAPFEVAYNRAINLNKFTDEEYKNFYDFQYFNIKSKFGYNLKAAYIPKKENITFNDGKERVVILVHGWTSCRLAMLGYAKSYMKLGFHVFIYDQRNHLDSDKVITTMGNKEADDLQTVIEVVKQRLGENIIIGTHGESIGAATVMIHAGRYQNVDFLVEDCGYNTLKELSTFLCKRTKKLPVFPTIVFSELAFRLLAKTSPKELMPEQSILKCENIPMLFTHGEKDDVVPAYMAQILYDKKPGFKMIRIYKDSGHARSQVDYKQEYENDLKSFLTQSKII